MKKVLYIVLLSFLFIINAKAKELNGWIYENNKTYYYENGVPVTGYKTIDNEKYFFKNTGVLQNNIVFLGDSITQGYDLSEYFNNYPVINSGIGGNTTRDVLNDIYNRVYVYNPSKIIILIGTNDTFFDISSEETVVNINHIINNIKTNLPNTKIYLESIYPINNSNDPKINHWMVGDRTNDFLNNINNQIKNIEGVTYINVYDSLLLNGLLNINYTRDGLHLNSDGYDFVTNILKPYVESDDSSSNIKDKWYYQNNNIYYYEDGEKIKGYKTINGIEYYFDNETGEQSIPVDSIELNKTELVIEKENSELLQTAILPSNAKNKTITWSSSDEEIATVDQNGLVTALKEGNVTISATSINNKTAECNVTVIKRYPKVKYKTHIQSYGWQDYVTNGGMAGTSGEGKRLEAIKIKLEDQEFTGNIFYRTHVQSYGWEENFKKNNELSGTEGQEKRLEAIEIKLDGEVENYYDVYYRVHAQSFGWLGWARNGEQAGTAGYAKRLEAIEIKLVAKGGSVEGYGNVEAYKDANAPTEIKLNKKVLSIEENDQYQLTATISPENATDKTVTWTSSNEANVTVDNTGKITAIHTGTSVITAKTVNGKTATCTVSVTAPITGVAYTTHVQSFGWQEYVSNGEMAGTSGEAKRLEAIKIKLKNQPYTGDIEYRTHIQSYGWEKTYKKNDEMSGTSGEAKRLEAIEIRLTGQMAEHFDIYYRVHAQSFGWLAWAKNGEQSGTAGYAKRLEGIEIALVEKGTEPPARDNQNEERSFIENK